MDTFEFTILIGAGVIVVGIVVVAGLKALYQRGFEAGQSEGFNFSPEEFQKIYWLALNGFTRLLLLGERGAGTTIFLKGGASKICAIIPMTEIYLSHSVKTVLVIDITPNMAQLKHQFSACDLVRCLLLCQFYAFGHSEIV